MPEDVSYTAHYETWHNRSQEHLRTMLQFYARTFDSDLRAIAAALGKPLVDLRLLDFGCGMGLFLHYCQTQGVRSLTGFELDEGQASYGRGLGLNVEQSPDPLAWLEAHKDEYDVIFSIDVLEHVPTDHLPRTLRCLRGLLGAQGRFVATVPNGNAALAGRWRYIDWTHRTSFSEHSLTHVLRMAGFQDPVVSESEVARFYRGEPGVLKKASEAAILKVVRFVRTLQYVGELGWDEGLAIPLTTNIKVIACK